MSNASVDAPPVAAPSTNGVASPAPDPESADAQTHPRDMRAVKLEGSELAYHRKVAGIVSNANAISNFWNGHLSEVYAQENEVLVRVSDDGTLTFAPRDAPRVTGQG